MVAYSTTSSEHQPHLGSSAFRVSGADKGHAANRTVAVIIILLAMTEFSLGFTAVLTGLPIGLAVTHNWLAGLMLLALLKLTALSRSLDCV